MESSKPGKDFKLKQQYSHEVYRIVPTLLYLAHRNLRLARTHLKYLYANSGGDYFLAYVTYLAYVDLVLSLRRLADHSSKANLRKLVNLAGSDINKKDTAILDRTFAKSSKKTPYQKFADTVIAHQDLVFSTDLIHELPNRVGIERDLVELEALYGKLADLFCSEYSNLDPGDNFEAAVKTIMSNPS